MIVQHDFLCDALKDYRSILRLTQVALAAKLDVTGSRVAQLESANNPGVTEGSFVFKNMIKLGIHKVGKRWELRIPDELLAKVEGKIAEKKQAIVQQQEVEKKVRETEFSTRQKAANILIDLKSQGLTQSEIADKFGIGQATVSGAIRGAQPLGLAVAQAILEGRKVSSADKSQGRGRKAKVVNTYNKPVNSRGEEVKRENPKLEIHTRPSREVARMERPELPARRTGYTPPPSRLENAPAKSTAWIDASVPIVPVQNERRSRDITVITPEYHPCEHCNGTGKVQAGSKVETFEPPKGFAPIWTPSRSQRDLPEGHINKTTRDRMEKDRLRAEREAEKAAKPKKVDKLPASEFKELALQNRTRRASGLPELIVQVRTCLSCRGEFESYGARMCKHCRNVESPTIQGLEVL